MKKVIALFLTAVTFLFTSSGMAVQIVYDKPICKFEERLIFETGVGLKKEYQDCASFSGRNGKNINGVTKDQLWIGVCARIKVNY